MDNDSFVFKSLEIIPKRFEVVLPAWEQLLDGLSITVSIAETSDINRVAMDATYEEKVVQLLYDLYKQVKAIESPEEQRSFIEAHQSLRLALVRAKEVVEARS
jgi:hypothetical protein